MAMESQGNAALHGLPFFKDRLLSSDIAGCDACALAESQKPTAFMTRASTRHLFGWPI
jgi:hypothetical protein